MYPQERRHHVVYFTDHTEYHCRDQECVGVRDRTSGAWQIRHPALRGKLVGGLSKVGMGLKKKPSPGLRLIFSGKRTVMTSRVISTNRPPRDSILYYTSFCRSGVIEK